MEQLALSTTTIPGCITRMDDFLLRALIGGLLLTIATGPLGCLVVWQRMAYFGAALAHASLLGIAIGLWLNINLQLSILLICIIISILLVMLERRRLFNSDTVLGILAHASLALGLVVIALVPSLRIDLVGYLFGDILSVSKVDIIWLIGGVSVTLIVLKLIWRPLLSLTLQRELALVDGVAENRTRLLFLLLLSLLVALSIQVVGLLLIVSMLLIPAATARHFAHSPEQMAVIAAAVGMLAVLLGLGLSMTADTPAGPSIVVAASLLFAVTLPVAGSVRNHG